MVAVLPYLLDPAKAREISMSLMMAQLRSMGFT